MKRSIDADSRVSGPVRILICGRALIRLYAGDKCIGFADSYRFAQVRAEELEKTQLSQFGSQH